MLLSLSLSVLFQLCVDNSHHPAQGAAICASGAYQLSASAFHSLSGVTTGATA